MMNFAFMARTLFCESFGQQAMRSAQSARKGGYSNKSGLATMINIINHDPQYRRDLAQRKREMAGLMHTDEARASFMNAADYYEQIAREVEAKTDDLDEPDSLGG